MFSFISTYKDFSSLLGVKEETIKFYLYTAKGQAQAYKEFDLPKRGGGSRRISVPCRGLMIIQRAILDKILTDEKIQNRQCVYSYVKGRGSVEMAARHVSRNFVARIDISDFFGTITFPRVLGALQAFPLKIPYRWAVVIAKLCTHNDKLPQGAPTSPALSNLICRRMDSELIKYAKIYGFHYSRYSDDIVISGKTRRKLNALAIRDESTFSYVAAQPIKEIIEGNSFHINESKTRVYFPRNRQMVVGVVCNKKANVTRDYIRQIRTLIHLARQSQANALDAYKSWGGRNSCTDIAAVIRGKISYVRSIKGSHDKVFLSLAESYNSITGVEKIEINTPPSRNMSLFNEKNVFVCNSFHKNYGDPKFSGTDEGVLFKTGSCFFVSGVGIVTSFHNLYHKFQVLSATDDKFPPFDIEDIIFCRPDWDIVVLDASSVFRTFYRTLRVEEVWPTIPGMSISLLGYPHFTKGDKLSQKNGVITQEKERFGMQLLAVDIDIKEGESGGPVVNDRGRVVGIVRSRGSDHFVVPIQYILSGIKSSGGKRKITEFESNFTRIDGGHPTNSGTSKEEVTAPKSNIIRIQKMFVDFFKRIFPNKNPQ